MNSDNGATAQAVVNSHSLSVELLANSVGTQVVSLERELRRLTALQEKLKTDEVELLAAVREEEAAAVRSGQSPA